MMRDHATFSDGSVQDITSGATILSTRPEYMRVLPRSGDDNQQAEVTAEVGHMRWTVITQPYGHINPVFPRCISTAQLLILQELGHNGSNPPCLHALHLARLVFAASFWWLTGQSAAWWLAVEKGSSRSNSPSRFVCSRCRRPRPRSLARTTQLRRHPSSTRQAAGSVFHCSLVMGRCGRFHQLSLVYCGAPSWSSE